MATARVELAARVAADTEYVSHIIDPLPMYPEHAGMIAAHLVSGEFEIHFAYGYMPPAEVHDAIATLRAALDRLDIDVDVAMDRQVAAIIVAVELAAIDAESPAEGHEVVAEWTRGTA